MSTLKELWRKLAGSKKYREEFVAAQVKRGIPFQIRAMMKQRGWSQDDLALHADIKQGVVSRAANPNYGNLTLNTIIRIAAGFDVAFVGRFVPFSELSRWFSGLSEEAQVPTFHEENAVFASQLEADLAAQNAPGFAMDSNIGQQRGWSAQPSGKLGQTPPQITPERQRTSALPCRSATRLEGVAA